MNIISSEVKEQDIREYWERGYWISPPLLDQQTILEIRQELQRIFNDERDSDNYSWFEFPKPEPGSGQIHQVTNAWWVNDRIKELVTHPSIGKMAAALMKTPEVRLWHDQVLSKPGTPQESRVSDEGNVGWHQDYAYWQCSNNTNMCSIWLALQDTDLSNGGMRTIVGSHKWGAMEGANTFYEKDLNGLQEKYGAGHDWIDEPCKLKAGQASFHHALTFHGSGPNQTPDPRLCVIMHVMSEETGLRTDGKWHLCATLLGPNTKTNDRFEGPLFPTLYSEINPEEIAQPER